MSGSGGRSGGFAIIVGFNVVAEARSRFVDLLRANAATSVQLEPGCHQFDVLTPRGDHAWDVVLYEIYHDRAAFEAHLATAHFKEFDLATTSIVTAKTVAEFHIIENVRI